MTTSTNSVAKAVKCATSGLLVDSEYDWTLANVPSEPPDAESDEIDEEWIALCRARAASRTAIKVERRYRDDRPTDILRITYDDGTVAWRRDEGFLPANDVGTADSESTAPVEPGQDAPASDEPGKSIVTAQRPPVTVLDSKYVKSGDAAAAQTMDLDTALQRRHRDREGKLTDAHMQLAQSSDRSGVRLCSADVGVVDIWLPRIGFDIDGPGHEATPEWRQETERMLAKIEHRGYHYSTKNGYRLILELATPFAIRTLEDADAWKRRYLEACKDINRAYSVQLSADESCADWTRLLRLPKVQRDGEALTPEIIPINGTPYSLPKDPGPSEDEIKRRRSNRAVQRPNQERSMAPAVDDNVGADPADSKLGRIAERLGYLGKRLRNGKRVVVCPNDAQHSTSTPDGSDCVLFPANNELGGFHCSHEGCKELKARDVIAQWEAEEAEHTAAWLGTDKGLAERFVWLFGSLVRWCPPLNQWLVWDGKRWAPDENMRVPALAKEVSRLCWREMALHEDGTDKRKQAAKTAMYAESRQGLSNMIELAKPDCIIQTTCLDADPYALNVKNGTLDLRTGVLRPHRREDYLTKLAPVNYRQNAQSELWDKAVETVTAGDESFALYLQRVAGYTMLGVCSEKVFFFCYGPPDGGKSTFLNAVGDMLGEYRCATSADTWLKRGNGNVGGNRGDIVRLRGVRMATCSEFKVGSAFDEALMKQITGGDRICQSAKYKDEVEFYPTSTPFLAGNDRPRISADDDGMWRRARCIPFTNSIPLEKQDAKLSDKLREPAAQEAILAWAVAGSIVFHRDGRIGTCVAVENATNEYRSENDAFGLFVDECCERGPDYWVSSADLYRAYSTWTKEQKRYLLGRTDFADKLEKAGMESKKKSGDRGWKGLRLRDDMRS